MKRLLVALVFVLSTTSFANRVIPDQLKKWWPMCVLDATNGNANGAIAEVARMAAECGVFLEIIPKKININANGADADKLVKAAAEKCNISHGYQSLGVNRGSVLTILSSTTVPKELCHAKNAVERTFCGQMGFDPGDSFKVRMGNTGYWAGVAEKGQPAMSAVAGKGINPRDISAVALGQGMMSLPQGYGAGNGVGSENEGQAAGGSNVSSGWSDYGCKKMREAAFDNPYASQAYVPIKEYFPTDVKLEIVDLFDKSSPPFFGLPYGQAKFGLGQAAAAAAAAPPPNGVASLGMTPQQEFFKEPGVPRSPATSTASTIPEGHKDRTSPQVTSIGRQEKLQPPAKVADDPPTSKLQAGGNKAVMDEGVQIDEKELAKQLAEQGGAPQDGTQTTAGASEGLVNIATAGNAGNTASADALLKAARDGADKGKEGEPHDHEHKEYSTSLALADIKPQAASTKSPAAASQSSSASTALFPSSSSPAGGGTQTPSSAVANGSGGIGGGGGGGGGGGSSAGATSGAGAASGGSKLTSSIFDSKDYSEPDDDEDSDKPRLRRGGKRKPAAEADGGEEEEQGSRRGGRGSESVTRIGR